MHSFVLLRGSLLVLLLHLPHLAHGDRRSIVTPSSYFRRALGEDIGDTDSEDTGSGGNDSGQCNPDCSDNSDCAEGFVCYRRKPNENIPDCCSGDKSKGTNYCVSAGCAAYTDTSRTEDDPPHWVLFDDDHLIKELETTLKQCQGNCKSDNDCFGNLICYKDLIPTCCSEQSYTNITGLTSLCGPATCNDAVAADGNATAADGNATDVALCFSGTTTVHVMGRGSTPMEELKVGDQVLSSRTNDDEVRYQTVYAFAHVDRTRSTKFLQFFLGDSDSDEAALEMSAQHFVYSADKDHPVRADSIRVGDLLQTRSANSYSQQSTTVKVASIRSITKKGLYAPLTQDGSLLVGENDVVASNYVTIQKNADTTGGYRKDNDDEHIRLAIIGTIPWIHQADLTHLWLSPLRLMCTVNHQLSICTNHNQDGMLYYVAWGFWLVEILEQQPLWSQLLVLTPAVVLLSCCTLLEGLLIGNRSSWWYVTFVIATGMILRFLWLLGRKKSVV